MMLPAVLCGILGAPASSSSDVTRGGGVVAFEAMTRCVRAMTLSVFVGLPLGVAAHVAAVAALPGRLCAACARETAMVLRGGGGGPGKRDDDDEGEVRAMLSGLWAVATKPTLALACAREVKEDAEILRDLRRKTEEAIEGYKSVSATEREKFEAACARLAEEERARERLREQLTTTREELKRERQRAMARDGRASVAGDRGVGALYVTTAMLGVMLLYFHDIDEVHNVDKKIAMLVPAFWMFVMTFKTQSVMRLCAMLNLIGFGYFAHIVLSHKRALGAVTRTVVE